MSIDGREHYVLVSTVWNFIKMLNRLQSSFTVADPFGQIEEKESTRQQRIIQIASRQQMRPDLFKLTYYVTRLFAWHHEIYN